MPIIQAKVPYSQGKQGQFWGTRLSTRIGDKEEEEELADDAVDLVIDALMKWTAAEGFFLHATQFFVDVTKLENLKPKKRTLLVFRMGTRKY